MEAKLVSGVSRTIDPPAALAQNFLDVAPFYNRERPFADRPGAPQCRARPSIQLQTVAHRPDHRPLDGVFELADVAGPVVLLQRRHNHRRNLVDASMERPLPTMNEEPHQPRDVFTTLTKRR